MARPVGKHPIEDHGGNRWGLPLADGSQIVIGGQSAKFEPITESSKWDGEAHFHLDPRVPPGLMSAPVVVENRLEVTNTQTGSIYRWYAIDGNAPDELEFEVEFLSEPGQNFIEFDIDAPAEITAWYQGTQAAERALDPPGRVSSRPENVEDSYALYWPKNNNKYKVGKFAHIYRMFLHEVGNPANMIWCTMSLNMNSRKLRATWDRNWAANATYPVIFGPTLGFSGSPSSTSSFGAYEEASWQDGTSAGAGDLDTGHVYGSGSSTANIGLYSGNTQNTNPGGMNKDHSSHASVSTGASAGETSASMAGSVLASTDYCVVCRPGASGLVVNYDSSGDTGNAWYNNNGFGVPEDPLDGTGFWTQDSARRYAFWVSYTESGGNTLTADSGTFTLTGTAAGLAAQRQLASDSGTFTLTGTAAALQAQRQLAGDSGTFTLTGTAAGLQAQRQLAADSGSFILSGTDAALTYSPATGNYTLVAESGAFTLSGTAAALQADRQLSADSGTFTLTGTAAGLARGFTLAADSGAFTLTGTDVDFLRNLVLTGQSGTFTLTGAAVTLTYSGTQVWTVQVDATTVWSEQSDASTTWTEQ